ncbi:hypothetical protein TBR22_A50480 [Luteitalea sp. TBR-22]|uniref:vanadium-dependent haloperoxidase n=1 Tax=Luteitalea sp. TBR-22 TaxID=2802971 RepID=UPI001AFCA305|nr:vanadium-dependent haloperoxidase [Luteitalea sp. TBR-22]BCS35814.1 hypothetical protein TBR22_A50480 [Luteitalea sp. TBR-22]
MSRVQSFIQLCLLATSLVASAPPVRAESVTGPNPVIEWATLIQPAIHAATSPRSAGTSQILHTMAMLAVYDAVVAIEGGTEPFAARIDAAPYADVRAAVATAAYVTTRPRIAPARLAYLDDTYATYMAAIAEGPSKAEGTRVGRAAGEAMLARRANDNYSAIVPYACSASPLPVGEFEPDSGCPASPSSPQPVDAKVGQIRPFTFRDIRVLRPTGPAPFGSAVYVRDYEETRAVGRIDSVVRTPEQTDIAYFWAENPYVHWNRNLVALAVAAGLDARDAARFFALVHVSASDAVIAGFEAKYHYRAWRPRTAIPAGDRDPSDRTDADPTWRPLLMVNHPEYPSGHGFWSTAVVDAVAAFFGTSEVRWTLSTSRTAVPQLVLAERTYENLDDLITQIGNARIWGGLHWRNSVQRGEAIGARVARHVATHHFRPRRASSPD